ncbi:DNA polymerase II [Motiliproteus sp. SC1-56]|uniref:DNA polymerase II n=1 Tax=Motiliproteus sp. SC1-56 TaxID=2799565 RepID=UPI001A8C5333|nr:DNA polymerase II [Motiliproteus sp. SC1-56]
MVEGFLLDQQVRQGLGGLILEYWLSSDQGPFRYRVEQQEAVFFVAAADSARAASLLQPLQGWRSATLRLQSLDGTPVCGLYFDRLDSLYRARELLQQAGIALYEDDIRPAERFLMERFIRAGMALDAAFPGKGGTLTGTRIRPSDYRPHLRLLSLDIETAIDHLELFSIALQGEGLERVLMKGDGEDTDQLRFLPDEPALLRALETEIAAYDPDLLIGWNLIDFDLRYLQRVAERHGLSLRLGRDATPLRVRRGSGTLSFVDLPGRVAVDGIECLKSATYRFESYALDAVARELLGRGKLIEEAGGRGEEISRLYRDDPQALAAYNLEDCRLVSDIFAEARLVDYLIERASLTGLPLGKVGGSAAAFDHLYLPRLHRAGYVAPRYASGPGGLQSPGGYVMDSRPGLYDHVLVLDFKSLYPSIIRSFLIDPLGLAEAAHAGDGEAEEREAVDGFNGARFHRQRHILPQLLAELGEARGRAKAQANGPLSQAIKIIMNAFYGVLGSPVCRFFDHRLSGSITLRGHQILKESREYLHSRGYTVIYGDTDSLFVWLQRPGCSDRQADRLGQGLAAAINRWWRRRLAREFGLESFLEVEYESHYRRFLMPRLRGADAGSKKRYAGLLAEPGGEARLVFKGLESVRSDWTPLARRFQQGLFERVFNCEPVQDFVRDQVAALLAGELDDALIYRKRLRRPLEEYVKNQPPQVQAARLANASARDEGRAPIYRRGSAVSYLITTAGPQPAQYRSAPIDYQHYLEKQLAPVADGILPFIGLSFGELVEPQLGLF